MCVLTYCYFNLAYFKVDSSMQSYNIIMMCFRSTDKTKYIKEKNSSDIKELIGPCI